MADIDIDSFTSNSSVANNNITNIPTGGGKAPEREHDRRSSDDLFSFFTVMIIVS